MPRPVEALPCGSRSTTRTRLPRPASAAPRLTAVVVLPTPPFWLAIAIILARPEGRSSAGRASGLGLSTPRAEPAGAPEASGPLMGDPRADSGAAHGTS